MGASEVKRPSRTIKPPFECEPLTEEEAPMKRNCVSLVDYQVLGGWREFTLLIEDCIRRRGRDFTEEWTMQAACASADGSHRAAGALMAARAAVGICE